ncbi:hypothetical protein [Actinomadura xylanilytica]
MALWKPDSTFYASPRDAVAAPPESRRVYVTNSLYGSWDDQFYPDGVGA